MHYKYPRVIIPPDQYKNKEYGRGHHYIYVPNPGVSLDTLWHYLFDKGITDIFEQDHYLVGYNGVYFDDWSEELIESVHKTYL